MEHNTELFLHAVLGICLVVLIASGLYLLSKRFSSIPHSVSLVVAGAILALLHLEPLDAIRLSPGSVMFIFLPILLFESAFNFEFREFKKILTPGFALATIGLLISALVVALPLTLIFEIDFMASFLFGSVIASTDPIAVLSIFKQLGVPRRLQLLVDGESFLNDATSVIMFRILLPFVAGASAEFAGSDIINGFGSFLYVLIGGGLIGLLFGWLFSRLISHIKNVSSVEIALTIILAHMVFIVADHYLKVSGIIAVLVAGLVLGNYGRSKISPKVTHNMHIMWDFLVYISTSIVFLLIGYEIHVGELLKNIDIVLASTSALLIGRAISVYLVGGGYNLVSKSRNKIPLSWLHIANWGGLRGALPLIVILSLPETFEYRELFLELVVGAILFTLIINALTIKKLINILGVDKLNIANEIEIHIAKLLIVQNIKKLLEDMRGLNQVSESTFEKYEANINKDIKKSVSKIRDWLSDNTAKEYNSEFRKILQRYAINVEKTVYVDLFKKNVITEVVYNKLKGSLEDQIDFINAEEAQFSEALNAETSADNEEKEIRHWEKLLSRLIHGKPSLSKFEEYYMYHKARLLGDEKVMHELNDLEISSLEELSDDTIAEVGRQYKKLLEHNRNTLNKAEKKSPETIATLERIFIEAESQELTEKILEELGEQGRLSQKALQSVAYKSE